MSKLPKITKNIKGFGSYLPAKIPKQSSLDLVNKKKKDFVDKLASEKRLLRIKKAKKISWRKITPDEYEVSVKGSGDKLIIGNVKRSFNAKWSMHPGFKAGNKPLRYTIAVNKDYWDWHEASRAMVELWIVT